MSLCVVSLFSPPRLTSPLELPRPSNAPPMPAAEPATAVDTWSTHPPIEGQGYGGAGGGTVLSQTAIVEKGASGI